MDVPFYQVCKCCGVEKPLTDYHKEKKGRLGVQTQCKVCLNARRSAKYYANIEAEKARNKAYKDANKDRSKRQAQARLERNPTYRKEYYEANKQRISERNAEYFQRVKKRRAEIAREKYRNDPIHAMKCGLRLRTRLALKAKGFTKNSRIKEILGCDSDTLKTHLEGQFTSGMTWENRGHWHVDHRIPLGSAKTEEELLALCHFSNLQPLWAADNFSKGGRLPIPEEAR